MKKIFFILLLSALALSNIFAQGVGEQSPTQVMLTISGDPTSEYAVTWRTKSATSSMAQIAVATANPKLEEASQTITGMTPSDFGGDGVLMSHEVRFEGLKPNTQYVYRVGDGKTWSEWFHFTTAKDTSEPFSILYFGDVQNNIYALGSRTIRQAYKHFGSEASLMLFAGDLVSRSRQETWDEFMHAGAFVFGSLPSIATPGNHEYDSKEKNVKKSDRVFSPHWGQIFSFPANAPRAELRDRFYYLDYQGVRFVSLDSPALDDDDPKLSELTKWLEQVLGAKDAPRWKVVFTHYPIYSCSKGRNNAWYRELIMPILEKYGVDIVLQGHDHTYCRGFAPAKSATSNHNQPLYVVSVAGPKMYELSETPWAEVQGKDTQLYQHIRFADHQLCFESYDVTGKLFDAFRILKDPKTGLNTLIEDEVAAIGSSTPKPMGKYVSVDFHNHTSYSGGDYSLGYMIDKAFGYGLDWIVESGHGGAREYYGAVSGKDLGIMIPWDSTTFVRKGDPHKDNYMWRWQVLKEFSFPEILKWRQRYGTKTIIQGFEWNVPGHEHADVCILGEQFSDRPNADALAEFEYKFDNADKDKTGGNEFGWTKSILEGHAKTIEAVQWLQKNYPEECWIIPTHPERSNRYTIADFRDMNDAGPSVVFGFDGIPGHQKGKTRGFSKETAPGSIVDGRRVASTFGGVGYFTAKVGGLWDALLSEGRKWWIFGSSDYHGDGDFLPGEFQKNYYYTENPSDPAALIAGVKSGNGFAVMGDLITDMRFEVNGVVMGQTTAPTDTANVVIHLYDPESNNHNTYSSYTNPQLDHVDIIMGEVSGMKKKGSPEYNTDSVETTRVIARFDRSGKHIDANGIRSQAWKDLGNGWKKIVMHIPVKKDSYIRLRGTNNPVGSSEVDDQGHPMPEFGKESTTEKTFADLWFYSNPVFIKCKK